MRYIHQLESWPNFHWDAAELLPYLSEFRFLQGQLKGTMQVIGLSQCEDAVLLTLTQDVIKSSEIEGEKLDKEQVRSSLVRKLGMDRLGLVPSDRDVDGVVEMMLDATQNYKTPLTQERLFAWHAALFPAGYSGMTKITVGHWRSEEAGPMQVISGRIGRVKVHFEAPPAERVPAEMECFLAWFNSEEAIDPVIKAVVAHIWFVTIHPFEDGNGRIARALTDLLLARSENSEQRFYSFSSQIQKNREKYYTVLEDIQKGDLAITEGLIWFLSVLIEAVNSAAQFTDDVLKKARFWEYHKDKVINERQRKILNLLMDGFEGKLTSSKWAKIAHCSQDTATRDINDLIQAAILKKDEGGGRSTSYSLQF